MNLSQAVDALNADQVIAYPTEAVFGVGCNPDSEVAVQRLLALKQRPVEKGLILIAADYAQLANYVDDSQLTDAQRQQIFATWPGPVTWVMPAKPSVPAFLTGQFDTIAVRVSQHPLVQALCQQYGKPITSTSANLTGQPACRSVEEVKAQLGADFCIVEGDTGARANPSEIRDAKTGQVLRQG
ncbi:Threonylcarbamoyl-AMP synthase [Vibrio stylophorae]|uniref:Threonylcarbamoyl-AMP synthase n=1 Tax=Vibrio stylophorae TaxID=659351 RepID=A0ABN8DQK8_9VIBR|nr:Threonylcarbamoyl-AMP synthase [Vibrio stylophorae]